MNGWRIHSAFIVLRTLYPSIMASQENDDGANKEDDRTINDLRTDNHQANEDDSKNDITNQSVMADIRMKVLNEVDDYALGRTQRRAVSEGVDDEGGCHLSSATTNDEEATKIWAAATASVEDGLHRAGTAVFEPGGGGGQDTATSSLADADIDTSVMSPTPETPAMTAALASIIPPILDSEAFDEEEFENTIQSRINERTVVAIDVRSIPCNSIATSADRGVRNAPEIEEGSSSSFSLKARVSPSRLWLVVWGFLSLGLALCIVIPSLKSESSKERLHEPTLKDSKVFKLRNLQELLLPLSGDSLFTEASPQYRALEWLAEDDFTSVTTDTVLQQQQPSWTHQAQWSLFLERYSIAVLYFATDGPNSWSRETSFLNHAQSVCEWQPTQTDDIVIQCSESGSVTDIKLGTLALTKRSLPKETLQQNLKPTRNGHGI